MPPSDQRALTADEMNTLLAEVATGVPREESRLAPLDAAQLRFWTEMVAWAAEQYRLGRIIDIPPEFPDAGEDNR